MRLKSSTPLEWGSRGRHAAPSNQERYVLNVLLFLVALGSYSPHSTSGATSFAIFRSSENGEADGIRIPSARRRRNCNRY